MNVAERLESKALVEKLTKQMQAGSDSACGDVVK